jgi:beta-N-acetylhexosaminidase
VRAGRTVDEAAVEALAAGADLLQIGSPEDQGGVSDSILAALESGELSEARLREAAARVLELKLAQGLFELPRV